MRKRSKPVGIKLLWLFLCFVGVLLLLTGNSGTQLAIANSEGNWAGEARAQNQNHDAPQFINYLPVIRNTEQDPIPYYLDQLDFDRMVENTSVLVNQYGPRHHDFYQVFAGSSCNFGPPTYSEHNLNRASVYVYHQFELSGYDPYSEFLPDWHETENILAEKIGSVYPNTYIELGAHVDTVATTPGASDNAGGVAAMLEIARIFKDYPNRHSWRFISFVGEECYLRGSRYHVELIEFNGEGIKAGLIMDGNGWSETAPEHMNCLWDNGDAETRRLSNMFNSVRNEYGIDINWRLCSPEGQWSDNYAYWERGLPAVLSIGGFPYADPHYHQCGDNMEAIDMQNVYKTAQENLAVLLKLDAEETDPGEYMAGEPAPSLPQSEMHSH
jgi:hypothetical protein